MSHGSAIQEVQMKMTKLVGLSSSWFSNTSCLLYNYRTYEAALITRTQNFAFRRQISNKLGSPYQTAITTVSRFFTDKSSGAASEGLDSSEGSPARRQRSLLQRLHIHTSIKREKSPTPIRPPTAPAAVSGGSPSVSAYRHSPSRSDAATIEEITRIMPQSLLVSEPQQAGSSVKRQRSADGRDTQSLPVSAGQDGSTKMAGTTQLRSNVRMPPYLEKSRNEILATFQEVEWKQRFRLFHAIEHPETSPYKVDRSQVVIERNRYANVQPWDASRVKLKTPICGSDYVNASPIVLRTRSSEKPVQEMKYIATQGPKLGQQSHFWHLVHQETFGETGVIIMLTQLVEENKEKCSVYFPSELSNPTMSLVHEETRVNGGRPDGDPFLDPPSSPDTDVSEGSAETNPGSSDTVTLLSKEFDPEVACDVRKFQLTINGVSKTIIHYLFGRWPDFGKPEAEDRKGLIQLCRRSYTEAGDSPRFVHCSAGVGRTGTWIALDFLIREIEEDRLLDSVRGAPTRNGSQSTTNDELSKTETWGRSGPTKVNTPTQEDGFDKDEHDLIFETVNNLREQRMMMVVRDVQYIFLYEVMKEAFLEKYAARPQGAVVKEGIDVDTLPRHPKAPRISDAGEEEVTSEAETEIIEDETRSQKTGKEAEEDDPYSAVSPAILQRGMKPES